MRVGWKLCNPALSRLLLQSRVTATRAAGRAAGIASNKPISKVQTIVRKAARTGVHFIKKHIHQIPNKVKSPALGAVFCRKSPNKPHPRPARTGGGGGGGWGLTLIAVPFSPTPSKNNVYRLRLLSEFVSIIYWRFIMQYLS